MKRLVITLLLLPSICYGQDIHQKAKMAFAQIKLCQCESCNCVDCKCTTDVCTCPNCKIKANCLCQNCDCKNCTCTKEKCECKECNDFQAIYARAIKEQKVVVLEVGNVPHITTYPWKIVQVKAIQGEKSGYIVGVPKDGKLIRLDFAPNTPRQRIRLDVLHVIYPLGNGYVECPTCPQGRIFRQASLVTSNCVT